MNNKFRLTKDRWIWKLGKAVCMATETLLPWELRVCFRRVTHDGAGHVRLDIGWELHLSVNNDLVQDNVWLLWLQEAHYFSHQRPPKYGQRVCWRLSSCFKYVILTYGLGSTSNPWIETLTVVIVVQKTYRTFDPKDSTVEGRSPDFASRLEYLTLFNTLDF